MRLKTPLWQEAEWVCQAVRKKRDDAIAACAPWPKTPPLLEAVNRLEFAVAGFKNRDMRALLYPHKTSAQKLRRRTRSPRSQTMALLRAHGLIRKVPGRHSIPGDGQRERRVITALLSARKANIEELYQDGRMKNLVRKTKLFRIAMRMEEPFSLAPSPAPDGASIGRRLDGSSIRVIRGKESFRECTILADYTP